jgi:3-phosphoinositide dependent protein kinase-1
MVPERSEENVLDTVPSAGPSAMRSRPPSPVREESHTGTTPPTEAVPEYLVEQRTGVSVKGTSNSPTSSTAPPTPDLSNVSGGGGVTATERKQQQRKRRESVAQSERSMRSTKSGKSQGVAHPGIIRLHSTFNDQTSLCKCVFLSTGSRADQACRLCSGSGQERRVLDLAEEGELNVNLRDSG